ncbi:MAG: beta-galactosidase, partial [Duncaniella sp.]|nr:beta-galactosidase [Duncaniella sp.]
MKKFFIFLMPLLMTLPAWGMTRDTENFNFDWKFSRVDTPENALPQTDDSTWETVNLPHDFQISQPWIEPSADEKADLNNPVANVKSRLSSRAFKEMGTAWYRKTFVPRDEWKGRRVLLDFEGIMLNGDVFLNGEKIGGTDYGYLGFETDITDRLRFGESNVIAVKASTGAPENSRWYTGGGLYRDVKIVTTDKNTYFKRHPLYITTPSVSADSAIVTVSAEITFKPKRPDYITTVVDILDPDGKVVYTDTSEVKSRKRPRTYEYVLDSIVILNPSLWDIDSPSLYTASVRLLRND